MPSVCSFRNLLSAFCRVQANRGAPGIDHETIAMFESNLKSNLYWLSFHLRTGAYRPQTLRRVWIPKPGTKNKRPIGIPTVKDRVVQSALSNALMPIFENGFSGHSFGFRPGRNCKKTLLAVDSLLDRGLRYVIDADFKAFFVTIPHDRLIERVKSKLADRNVLNLVSAFIAQQVSDNNHIPPIEVAIPQGSGLSPLLANIYLDPLDHLIEDNSYSLSLSNSLTAIGVSSREFNHLRGSGSVRSKTSPEKNILVLSFLTCSNSAFCWS